MRAGLDTKGTLVMKHFLLATTAVLALAATPAAAQQKTVKIGFIGTFSGPAAALGNDMRNSFEVALEHHGRKLGGLPVEVIYEDDQIKPEVGLQKTQKLIESDKVDFLVGYIWSNVLLASLKPAVDSKTFLITTNAGPSQIAGELCSPYVFSTSWVNDQRPAAVGSYLSKKFKTLFLIAPNYAAGKDQVSGVKSNYKGQVVGEEMTRWPDQLDFSAEFAKVKAVKPEVVFGFYPGAAGTQFLTQYIQAGLKGQVPLYTSSVVDEVSLPHQKELALGVFGVSQWGYDMDNPTNKKYVADYKAKTKTYPSMYGAQTYDAVPLIDSAIKAVKGDLSKKNEIRAAMEKADFKSVRGDFKYGKNHIPIQNFYLQQAVKLDDGWAMKTGEQIASGDIDKYVGKCNMPR
jgi:branched-chain amino acid transport system substrate-binding protein